MVNPVGVIPFACGKCGKSLSPKFDRCPYCKHDFEKQKIRRGEK